MTHDEWGHVRGELLKSVGKNNFSAWIEPIAFDRIEDRTAQLVVPTSFIGTWVSQHFGDMILRHMMSAGAEVDRIEFSVDAQGRVPATERTQTPARTAAPARNTATPPRTPAPRALPLPDT